MSSAIIMQNMVTS